MNYSLLPAWRWTFPVFHSNFGVSDAFNAAMLGLAQVIFDFADIIWFVLLWVVQIATTTNLLQSSAKDIDVAAGDIFSQIQGTGAGQFAVLGGIAVIIVTIAVRRSILGGYHHAMRAALRCLVPLALVVGIGQAAAQDNGSGSVPLSPAWIAGRVYGYVNNIAGWLPSNIGSITPNKGVTQPTCATYQQGLDSEFTNAAGSNRQLATIPVAVSDLWTSSFLASWEDAQFGVEKWGEQVGCRYLETNLGTAPSTQKQIEADGRPSIPAMNVGVYGSSSSNVFTGDNLDRAMDAWAQCEYSGGWELNPATATNPNIYPTTSDCQKWAQDGNFQDSSGLLTSGKDPFSLFINGQTGGDIDGNTTGNSSLLKYATSFNGHNGTVGIVDGFFSLLAAIAYLVTLGGLTAGTVIGQLLLVAILALLPLILLLMALPTDRTHSAAVSLIKIGAGAALSRVVFGLLLGVLVSLTNLINNLLPSSSGIGSTLLTGITPLLAFYALHTILKATGLRGIMSVKGAIATTAGFTTSYARNSGPTLGSSFSRGAMHGLGEDLTHRLRHPLHHAARSIGHGATRRVGGALGRGSGGAGGPRRNPAAYSGQRGPAQVGPGGSPGAPAGPGRRRSPQSSQSGPGAPQGGPTPPTGGPVPGKKGAPAKSVPGKKQAPLTAATGTPSGPGASAAPGARGPAGVSMSPGARQPAPTKKGGAPAPAPAIPVGAGSLGPSAAGAVVAGAAGAGAALGAKKAGAGAPLTPAPAGSSTSPGNQLHPGVGKGRPSSWPSTPDEVIAARAQSAENWRRRRLAAMGVISALPVVGQPLAHGIATAVAADRHAQAWLARRPEAIAEGVRSRLAPAAERARAVRETRIQQLEERRQERAKSRQHLAERVASGQASPAERARHARIRMLQATGRAAGTTAHTGRSLLSTEGRQSLVERAAARGNLYDEVAEAALATRRRERAERRSGGATAAGPELPASSGPSTAKVGPADKPGPVRASLPPDASAAAMEAHRHAVTRARALLDPDRTSKSPREAAKESLRTRGFTIKGQAGAPATRVEPRPQMPMNRAARRKADQAKRAEERRASRQQRRENEQGGR